MRLIDADVLKNSLTEYFNRIKKIDKRRIKQLDAIYLDVIGAVKSSPTIEAEPIKHGEWLIDISGLLMCSKCGTFLDEFQKPSRYCPNCGAKMDEVKE